MNSTPDNDNDNDGNNDDVQHDRDNLSIPRSSIHATRGSHSVRPGSIPATRGSRGSRERLERSGRGAFADPNAVSNHRGDNHRTGQSRGAQRDSSSLVDHALAPRTQENKIRKRYQTSENRGSGVAERIRWNALEDTEGRMSHVEVKNYTPGPPLSRLVHDLGGWSVLNSELEHVGMQNIGFSRPPALGDTSFFVIYYPVQPRNLPPPRSRMGLAPANNGLELPFQPAYLRHGQQALWQLFYGDPDSPGALLNRAMERPPWEAPQRLPEDLSAHEQELEEAT